MSEVITYSDLLNKDIPPIEYLIDGIVIKSGLIYCYGASGSFKTNFLLYASMRGCEGKEVLGFHVNKPFKTLWIDEENRDIGMKDKISRISKGMEWDDINNLKKNIVVISSGFQIISPESMIWLDAVIQEHKPDMIVIDSIAKVFPLNERDEKDVRMIYSQLSILMRKYGVTFVIIHHARKKNFLQKSKDMDDIAGSREFSAMSDSMILIEDMGNSEYKLEQTKNRYEKKTYTINFSVLGDDDKITIVFGGLVHDKYITKENNIIDVLINYMESKQTKKIKRRDAIEFLKEEGFNSETIIKSLRRGVKNGKLQHKEQGYYETIV